MHDLTALRLNRQIDPKRSQQSRYPRTGGDDDGIGHNAPIVQADAEHAISARGDQLDEASRHSGAIRQRDLDRLHPGASGGDNAPHQLAYLNSGSAFEASWVPPGRTIFLSTIFRLVKGTTTYFVPRPRKPPTDRTA